jgi:hypothetical protein
MEAAIKEQVEKGNFVIPNVQNGQKELPRTPGRYFTDTIKKAFDFLYGVSSLNEPYGVCVDHLHEEINLRLAFAFVMRLGKFRTPAEVNDFIRDAYFTYKTPVKKRYNYVLETLRICFIRSGYGWDGKILTTTETFAIENEREYHDEQVRSEKDYYPAHWWRRRRLPDPPKNPNPSKSFSASGESGFVVPEPVNEWAAVDTVISEANEQFRSHELGSIGPAETRRLKGIFRPGDAVKLRQYFDETLKISLEIRTETALLSQEDRRTYLTHRHDLGYRPLADTSIWRPVAAPKVGSVSEAASDLLLRNLEARLGKCRFDMWIKEKTALAANRVGLRP